MTLLIRCFLVLQIAAVGVCLPVPVLAQKLLTLDDAVSLAQKNDPWLSGSYHRERALIAQSIAAGELPDPLISLGVVNLAADSFAFDQEPMTQIRAGVSQAFPRGNTRKLRQKQLSETGAQHPFMRQDRLAVLEVTVSKLWLDAYKNREAIRLIEKDRALFEHLVDVAESRYRSAVGKTNQQDFVRAQLELTRLEDRLTQLRQMEEVALAGLYEWLPVEEMAQLEIGNQPRPAIREIQKPDDKQLTQILIAHPKIKSFEKKIVASETAVELAKQKYKPQWGLNVGYGYRDDDPMGNERSDFFSLGLSFDLPLFTEQRQDKELLSATATEEAIRTDVQLALRSMRAEFEAVWTRLTRLNQRKSLYKDRLLLEIHNQAEASLAAYTNDAGDFAEAVRARIAELNASIDFLNINIDRLKTLAELKYFFASVDANSVAGKEP